MLVVITSCIAALLVASLIWVCSLEADDEVDGMQEEYVPEHKFHRNDEGEDETMRIAFGAGVIRNGVKKYVTREGAGISRVTGATYVPEVEEVAVKPATPVQPVEVDVMPWVKTYMDNKIRKGSHLDITI